MKRAHDDTISFLEVESGATQACQSRCCYSDVERGGISVDRTFGVCVFRGSSCEILCQFAIFATLLCLARK